MLDAFGTVIQYGQRVAGFLGLPASFVKLALQALLAVFQLANHFDGALLLLLQRGLQTAGILLDSCQLDLHTGQLCIDLVASLLGGVQLGPQRGGIGLMLLGGRLRGQLQIGRMLLDSGQLDLRGAQRCLGLAAGLLGVLQLGAELGKFRLVLLGGGLGSCLCRAQALAELGQFHRLRLAGAAIDEAGVARPLRGDDCRAFPHGRARRVCIIAVRLPPVAVYSSLTPAVFGLDPGGSGPFSWYGAGRVVYRHRFSGSWPGAVRAVAGRLSIAAGQAWAVIGGRSAGRAGRRKNRPFRTAYKPFSRPRRGLGLPDSLKTPPGPPIAAGKPV